MGAPFVARRKKAKDQVPKCKRVGSLAQKQYFNNNNRYQTFDDQANPRRSQILDNFKKITRAINKNYIKSKKKNYNLSQTSEIDSEKYHKMIEEKTNIVKMNKILRELLIKDTVPVHQPSDLMTHPQENPSTPCSQSYI